MAFIMLRVKYDTSQHRLTAAATSLCIVAGLGAILISFWLVFDRTTWLVYGRSSSTEALFEIWYQQLITIVLVCLGVTLVAIEGIRRKAGLTARQWWMSARNLTLISARGITVLGVVVLVCSLIWVAREEERRQIFRDRNFYGVLAIREYDADTATHTLGLRDGRISHGEQLLRHPDWPTSYFGPRSGVGLALRLHQLRKQADREFRVGIIGLGAGTLATYANAIIDPDKSRREYAKIRRTQFPDYLRFYELNPLVEAWAEEKFTFLEDARERGANVEIFNGDARLVLERQLDHEEAQNFDVLILDAFSSDAIPIHLLTREALETYWQHLQSDGILALHVSNRFLDVKPVVHRLAIDMGKEIIYTKNQDRDSRSIGSASWMIMTNNHEFMALTEVHEDERELPAPGPQWTDDFSRLFNVLRED